MSKYIFEIENLTISTKNKKDILKNTNLKVEVGEFLQITGINGSGKSTLIKTLLGMNKKKTSITGKTNINFEDKMFKIEEGRISNKGLKRHEMFKRISYINQENHVFYKNARQAISSSLSMYCKAYKEEDIDEILNVFGVTNEESNKTSWRLSGGQKRLITIMCGLIRAKNSPLLIMDEPINHLDFNRARKLNNYLIKLKQENPMLTIVVVSHCCMFSKVTRVVDVKDKRINNIEKYIFSPCSNFGDVDSNGFYVGGKYD